MIKIITFFTLFFIIIHDNVGAQDRAVSPTLTGNMHYAQCTSAISQDYLQCMFVVGSIAFSGRPISLKLENGQPCFGNDQGSTYGMNLEQMKDIVVSYYRTYPETRHLDAYFLTALALSRQVSGCEIAIPSE